MIERLRPHPHRGDIIAAGAVPLSLAALLVELRMTQWALGVRFAVVALITTLLMMVGWLARLEHDAPRAYHSILLIAGLFPLAVSLLLLAELLGAARPPGSGGVAWTLGVEAGLATVAARRANSAACTLIAAVSAGAALEAFVTWVFMPSGAGTFRAILLVLTLGYLVAAMRLRDARRRHAVALINAAGLATLVLGLSYPLGHLGSIPQPASAPFGWALLMLAVGFGLVAYAAVDREPGPGYLGVAVLLLFAYLVGSPGAHRGSLVGWPLFLLVVGAAGMCLGLRPRKPLPPPPDANISSPAPTVPLHRESSE